MAMKALRRSIKGEKADAPKHVSIAPKSELAIRPPKKVIKALYDYEAEPSKPHELSFLKGDFFHVISREDDEDWYEAANPLVPHKRGLVPVAFFQVIGKQDSRYSDGSSRSIGSPSLPDAEFGSDPRSHFRTPSSPAMGGPAGGGARRASTTARGGGRAGAMVYGIVLYDFQAERPDELDAKAGEAIIVIAQSNREWFVAKPIGRLGGPGLIPVSFVEIKDMATGEAVKDPHEAVQKAGVPKVEEWKKMAADYKNSSISLGRFVDAGPHNAPGAMQPPQQQQQQHQQLQHQNQAQAAHVRAPAPAPIQASVPRYCFENDKYWYIIECVLEDGSHWELSRYYQNFYDFQIKLLQAFPKEAGNGEAGGTRILPYMPGPVTYVTDAISNMRRQSLDAYVKRLLQLPPHISKSEIVRELFAPQEGDFELDPSAVQDFRLSQSSQSNNLDYQQQQQQQRQYQQQANGGGNYGNGTMHRQPSSITQDSSRNSGAPNGTVVTPASSTAALSQNDGYGAPPGSSGESKQASAMMPPPAQQAGVNASGTMTIKCWWGEDLVKVRVPSDISFPSLKEKLQERFKAREEIRVQWHDAQADSYHELMSNDDLDAVLQRTGGRLILFADYA